MSQTNVQIKLSLQKLDPVKWWLTANFYILMYLTIQFKLWFAMYETRRCITYILRLLSLFGIYTIKDYDIYDNYNVSNEQIERHFQTRYCYFCTNNV